MEPADLPTLWSVDSEGRLTLNFHVGQSRAMRSRHRFTFFIAGSQAGKTSLGPWWLWQEIRRCGAGDYLAVTATYDLFKLRMLPALREVLEHQLRLARYWSGDKVLELCDPSTRAFSARRADDPMWGRIILRSASAEGGLESATAKAAWLDECGQDEFTIHAWDAVRRRLALHRGRALGTTTPYNLGWLKTEVYDRWLAGDPAITVVNVPSTANPAFSAAEDEDLRMRLPDWKYRMFHLGLFDRPPGLIFGAYSDDLRADGGHRVADFALPPEWPRHVGIDFGAVNTATLWIAHDPEADVFYAYRETLEGEKTTAEHCRATLDRGHGTNVVSYTGGAPSEQQPRWDWGVHGVPVRRPAVADVEMGIDRVIELFKTRRLYVFESLRILRSQLGSYSRVVDASGQVTEKIKHKEQYHVLDALRYDAADLARGKMTGRLSA